MSDQKLREFLKNGAPPVPHASPYEFQAIVRRIQREDEEPRVKTWQIWSLVGASLGMVFIYAGFAWHTDSKVEEDLYRDMKNAEWVRANESASYKDWLQFVEYTDEADEI